MNPEDFTENAPGRLVKVGRGKDSYWAFVPNPLPPKLDFDLPLLSALDDARGAVGELAGIGRSLPNPHLLITPFVRREAVLSSRIEGSQATLDDLYAHGLQPQANRDATGRPQASDLPEVVNYVRALDHGLARISDLPVSKRLIQELHSILLSGVRGEARAPGRFRRLPVHIGSAGSSARDARFVPAPVPQMTLALNAWEKYLYADDYPLLVRLALIHYQFEAIHPFLDGNGRIGRLLLGLLLVSWELLPQPLLYLSAFFERHRQDYMDLLLRVSQKGAWEEWVAFFLRGVGEQSRDTIARVKRLEDLRGEWHQRIRGPHVPSKLLDLVDWLFEMPFITIPSAQKRLGVAHNTATKYIETLVREGILVPQSDRTYRKPFRAQGVLEAIRDT